MAYKLKTIFQPISFSKLFDAEMTELANDGWYPLTNYPRVISHETKEDTLISVMEKEEEDK
ncbi:MAG: hypothetical protein LUE29_09595 [Lachnospiraceae bacterium]|nr:hypothetical protein [Lachnospiraceae bacterium]